MNKEKDVILDREGKPIISSKIQKELDEKDAFDKAQQSLQKQMDDRANGKDLNEKADTEYERYPPKVYGTHRDLGKRSLALPIIFGGFILVSLAIIVISLITKEPMPAPYKENMQTVGFIGGVSF